MQITSNAIIDQIKAAAEHYRNNIANRFTSRALAGIPMDTATHTMVAMFTEHLEDYHLHGLDLEDLYLRLLATGWLVQQLRIQVLPNIRRLVYADAPIGQPQPADKVMRDMAIANFAPNLRTYAEMLTEIYNLALAYDRTSSGSRPMVSAHVRDLAKLPDYLGLGAPAG
jgi:hypothetical protein